MVHPDPTFMVLHCACHDILHDVHLHFDTDFDQLTYSFNPHVDYSFWRRLKDAWRLLVGRQLPPEELILGKPQIIALRRFINELPVEKSPSVTMTTFGNYVTTKDVRAN